MPKIASLLMVLGVVLGAAMVIRPGRATPGRADAETPRPTAAAIDAGGAHACVITNRGGVACWGANDEGQLGDGTKTYRRSPVMVVGLSADVVAIATGYAHTCALTAGGRVKCWGRNSNGGLGNGSTTGSTTPVDVTGLQGGVVAISAGMLHSCAVLQDGGVRCWGGNAEGALGDGTAIDRTTPVPVHGAPAAQAVVAGGGVSCLLSRDGGVQCWGANSAGSLGDGTHTNRAVPGPVSGLNSGVTAIALDYRHACALTTAHDLYCWGVAGWGQLGTRVDGANSPVPVRVDGVAGRVLTMSTGHSQTCAILDDHTARCWGLNSDGEIGDGTTELRGRPVSVAGFDATNVAVAAGGTFEQFFTCARSATSIQCWGDNGFGQLGAPSAIKNATTPRALDLPAAQLDLSGMPRVLTHRAFAAPVWVEVQDVLGGRFDGNPQPLVSLSVVVGPGDFVCPGGLDRQPNAGRALFLDCTVTAKGIYRIRASAPGAIPSEAIDFLALDAAAALPAVARDATTGGTPPAEPTPVPTSPASPTPTVALSATPTATPTATPPAGRRALSLRLTLDSYQATTGSGGWSNYAYTIHNLGSFDVDLAELTVQSWYSADAIAGGADDCAAGGERLGPGAIAPGDAISLSFGANLSPSPQYWPQCVARAAGYVIVEVHSRGSTKYTAGSWTVAYAVTR